MTLDTFAPAAVPFSNVVYQQLGGAHWDKLQGWFAGLANRNYGEVNLVCLGDSTIEGNGATAYNRAFPPMLQTALNNRWVTEALATHGRGWLSPLPSPSETTYTDTYVTVTGPSTGPTPVNGFGVGERTYDISTGYAGSTGSDTSPAAHAGLTGSYFVPPAGTYTVSWAVELSGTLASADDNNFQLIYNSTVLATSVNGHTAGTYEQDPVTVTTDGTNGIYIGTAGNNATTGAVYTGIIDPGTTFIYDLDGTSAFIFWVSQPGGGDWKYSVDGGLYSTVMTANSSTADGNVTSVTLGSSGAHTLRIKYAGSGPAYVSGLIECNGDESSGIQVHNGGNSGTTSGDWYSNYNSSGADIPCAGIAVFDPNLIIICLGNNDFNTSVPVLTFQANLSNFIALLQTACATAPGGPGTAVPILLIAGPLDATADAAAWQQYVIAMYAIAAGSDLIDVYDMTLRFPAADATQTWGMINLGDGEFSDLGYSAVADSLCDFLSSS